ncbi:MAG: hypothetical protein ABEJ93_01535, partial [Candidatus Nanohalobium sp.]
MEQGFAVVLVAGLAVFGLMFIANQSGFADTAPEGDKIVFAKENIGTVGGARADKRRITFRDFTVGETRGKIQAFTADQRKISGSLFSGKTINIRYNATQPTGGQVKFEVLGRTGKGKIWIKVNGEQVFNAATIAGATPTVDIPRKHLKPGTNNIEIGTTRGNLLSSASYSLEDIEVTVNDRRFHDFQSSFKLYQHELNNYIGSNLTFTIPMDASKPAKPLEVYVNGNRIFSQSIVRSTQEITVDKREAELTPGYNTIKFETEGEAKYSVGKPEINIRYLGRTRPGSARTTFTLSQSQLNYAEKEETEEKITFDYQNMLPSKSRMKLSLNQDTYSTIPFNGGNTVEINATSLETGENNLIIQSNGSYQIQNLQILS